WAEDPLGYFSLVQRSTCGGVNTLNRGIATVGDRPYNPCHVPWLGGILIGLLVGLSIAGAGGWLLMVRLNATKEKLRQADRLAELGTLTAGLAHEIKNPLSTVQLNLQLLQEDVGLTAAPRIVNRLATVTREAVRLRAILDDFLRYAGQLTLQPEQTDLNELLADLVDFLAPQAALTRVQLRQMPYDGPLMATVDPKLIKQALLNLMLNAMQLMPGGGELIVGAKTQGDQAVLTVTDTGPGISEAEQTKVFDAYFSKRRGGTGLGLAMTRRIAREHGGTVELASEVGKGSSFSIVLPLSGVMQQDGGLAAGG
ncbi:MAG: putative two-component system sensor histidine kinase, partial [Phycisphaerales bacterium]|nr:putative two-component system sensor histidine kinase [Phycisphaerales bacterium]